MLLRCNGTEEKENIGKMPTIMKIINGDNTFRKDDRNINKGSPILSSMNLILKLVYNLVINYGSINNLIKCLYMLFFLYSIFSYQDKHNKQIVYYK